jgi:hypothetical protein
MALRTPRTIKHLRGVIARLDVQTGDITDGFVRCSGT